MEHQQPAVQSPPTGKFALNYGLILGLASVALAVILYVTNSLLDQNWMTGVVSFLIMIGVIVYALSAYKKANGGFMSLSQALKVGLAVAVIGALIGAIYNFIFMSYIEPNFVDLIMEKQRQTMMESQPNMSEEQINQAMEMGRKFAGPWVTSAFQILGGLFFGFIISLVAGLIMKKENPAKM